MNIMVAPPYTQQDWAGQGDEKRIKGQRANTLSRLVQQLLIQLIGLAERKEIDGRRTTLTNSTTRHGMLLQAGVEMISEEPPADLAAWLKERCVSNTDSSPRLLRFTHHVYFDQNIPRIAWSGTKDGVSMHVYGHASAAEPSAIPTG